MGTQTLLLKSKQQWHTTHSDQLKPPEDMKHSLSATKLNTLSHAKLLSDCELKVCTVRKTHSS